MNDSIQVNGTLMLQLNFDGNAKQWSCVVKKCVTIQNWKICSKSLTQLLT